MTETPPITRLLIIDDSKIEQKLYRLIVERTGLVGEVISFYYAEEALDYLSSDPRPEVDCIALDINMPRMTGFEFLDAATERLGADFVKLVVVMLTTSLDPEDRRRASRHAVVREFFNKPLSRGHLERMIELLNPESENVG
ncbi:MAG: response regulator [Pseudomonadota bacterium]